jgi:hypothetical protein
VKYKIVKSGENGDAEKIDTQQDIKYGKFFRHGKPPPKRY